MSSFMRILLLVTSMVIVFMVQSEASSEPQQVTTQSTASSSTDEDFEEDEEDDDLSLLEDTLAELDRFYIYIKGFIDELMESVDQEKDNAVKTDDDRELEQQVNSLHVLCELLSGVMENVRAKLQALLDNENQNPGGTQSPANNGAKRLVQQDYLQFVK